MSTRYGRVSVGVLTNPAISPQAKGLYAVLAGYAEWDSRVCHVGRDRLAKDLNASVRSVSLWMKELYGWGVLDRKHRGLGRSRETRLLDFPGGGS